MPALSVAPRSSPPTSAVPAVTIARIIASLRPTLKCHDPPLRACHIPARRGIGDPPVGPEGARAKQRRTQGRKPLHNAYLHTTAPLWPAEFWCQPLLRGKRRVSSRALRFHDFFDGLSTGARGASAVCGGLCCS